MVLIERYKKQKNLFSEMSKHATIFSYYFGEEHEKKFSKVNSILKELNGDLFELSLFINSPTLNRNETSKIKEIHKKIILPNNKLGVDPDDKELLNLKESIFQVCHELTDQRSWPEKQWKKIISFFRKTDLNK